eukprot:TRINITY_DN7555_c8_g1_i2.p1 TRINITY_DN7555_c8_g1~~TRINITY_DN7555_c8_g1_i2.p1  ORF type:complete len:322 (+),score=62.94 TRINITY_DN7555_c8_g1_i2:48-1013(+)
MGTSLQYVVLLQLTLVVQVFGNSTVPMPQVTAVPGLENWTWPPRYLEDSSASGSGSGSGGSDTKVKPFWMILFGLFVGLTAVGSVWILKRREETKHKRMHQSACHDPLLKDKEEEHRLHEHDSDSSCEHKASKASSRKSSTSSNNPDDTLSKVIDIIKAPVDSSNKPRDDDMQSRVSTAPMNVLAPAGRGAPLAEVEDTQSTVSTAKPFFTTDSVSVPPSAASVSSAMKRRRPMAGPPSEPPSASSISAAINKPPRSVASEPPSASSVSHAISTRRPARFQPPSHSPALSSAVPPSSGLAISVVETSVKSTPSNVPLTLNY